VFKHPDYLEKRVLVIAPHADDAELAAFGLYRHARESWLLTLTVGEVDAGHYRHRGCSAAEAAFLKGRLRAWDSVVVPRWGGVPAKNCLQLGYYCLQLPAMQAAPGQPFGSREADHCDTRTFRAHNQISLPGDSDGLPTWTNLKADFLHMLNLVKPEIIVLPHPELDPHPDHVCAYELVTEALAGADSQPEALLCYANHLHDNDLWPMGEVHSGVALPPQFSGAAIGRPYCLVIAESDQRDKAMALGMMHDLQMPLPLKKRLRRGLQSVLTGRRWPAYGENEFFRKAVRRHELFWVRTPAVSIDGQGGDNYQVDPA
jgi:LmbE family N-acetylglucosaminyl deacetylase